MDEASRNAVFSVTVGKFNLSANDALKKKIAVIGSGCAGLR